MPNCSSNSLRTPVLSFHKFSKEPSLKETWSNLLGISKQPLKSHKVCSLHFPGGRKVLGALPTSSLFSNRQTSNSKIGRNVTDNTQQMGIVQQCAKDEVPTNENSEITEISALKSELEQLKRENTFSKSKHDELSSKYQLSVLHVVASDVNFKFYTSFPNYATFKAFFNYLQPACNFLMYAGTKNSQHTTETQAKRGVPRSLTPEQELFMVLVRLRCGLMGLDTANRFGISQAQYSRIERTWLSFVYHRLRALPIWYPAGYPSFISELYTGRSSDKQVTKDCGILNLFEPGDDLMTDKGFDIEDEMPQGVNLNIPPFLKDQQLSVQAENETRKIAAVRVHVERAIQCIKCFRILKNVFPLSMASKLNKVWVICSYLTLFQPPIISNDTEHE